MRLSCICDAVLELEDGTYIPLEIKSGNASPHTGEIIQLCAYAVLLEQLHGGRIDIGFILYETKSKHKEILFTDAVRRKLDFCVKQSSVTQPKHLYRRLRPRTLNARSVNS